LIRDKEFPLYLHPIEELGFKDDLTSSLFQGERPPGVENPIEAELIQLIIGIVRPIEEGPATIDRIIAEVVPIEEDEASQEVGEAIEKCPTLAGRIRHCDIHRTRRAGRGGRPQLSRGEEGDAGR